jgi:hypothetical protein
MQEVIPDARACLLCVFALCLGTLQQSNVDVWVVWICVDLCGCVREAAQRQHAKLLVPDPHCLTAIDLHYVWRLLQRPPWLVLMCVFVCVAVYLETSSAPRVPPPNQLCLAPFCFCFALRKMSDRIL